MTFIFLLTGTAQRYPVVQHNIIPDFCGFPDNNACAVVNKEALADGCAGVNLNPCQKTRQLWHKACRHQQTLFIQAVRNAMVYHCPEAGVKQYLNRTFKRRVFFFYHCNRFFPKFLQHIKIPPKTISIVCFYQNALLLTQRACYTLPSVSVLR